MYINVYATLIMIKKQSPMPTNEWTVQPVFKTLEERPVVLVNLICFLCSPALLSISFNKVDLLLLMAPAKKVLARMSAS